MSEWKINCLKETLILALIVGVSVFIWVKAIDMQVTSISEQSLERNRLLEDISNKLDDLHVTIEVN